MPLTFHLQNQNNGQSPAQPEGILIGCNDFDDTGLKRFVELAFGVLIALVNFIEIILLAKIKKKKVYEIILLSLSVSDLMFGLSHGSVSIFYLANACKFEVLCEVFCTFFVFFNLSSILHLLFITVDRFIAILLPFKHKSYLSKKRFYTFLAMLWILAIMITGLLHAVNELTDIFEYSHGDHHHNHGKHSHKYREHNHTFGLHPKGPSRGPPEHNHTFALHPRGPPRIKESSYKSGMEFVLALLILTADIVILVSYALIVYLTSSKKKNVPSSQKQRSKLPIICVAIALTFVLCTLPYAIARFIVGGVPFWPNFILVLNSGMNSIIYFFRVKIMSCFSQTKSKKSSGVVLSARKTSPVSSKSSKTSLKSSQA